MHQYKTVAQILLILSIFNLVFAIPVVREIDDARDDVVVPVVLRNVATTSKERRQPIDKDGTPSPSFPPPPDGSGPSHSSPPDGLQSDGPAPSHEIELASPPPGGPAALAGSLPPGGTASSDLVPASNQQEHSTLTSETHSSVDPEPDKMERFGRVAKWVLFGGFVVAVTGKLLWDSRHNLRRRTIGPDCSTAKESRHPSLDD